MNGFLIEVEPVLFRAGPLVIRWFGLLLLLAVLAGLWLTLRGAAARGVPAQAVLDLASWSLPAGFVGARLLHLLEHWEYYLTRPGELLDLPAGGLNFWGGLIVGGLTALWLGSRRGLPVGLMADAAAPALAVAEAIGRFGSFLNGDGQGLPSDLPWATLYRSSEALTPDFGVPRHPAQIYQLLADLSILAVLWLLRGAALPAGCRFWIWLALYGFSRVLIAEVRLEPPFLFGVQQGQLLGLAALALSAFAMIRLFRRPAIRSAA
jgi:phosphatidylglycerol:prolipoprotein diacylglycerol transferase